MTPQQLRSSILQLAIQGKLVEQRPEEGTGAELLREISTQRRRDAEAAKKESRAKSAKSAKESRLASNVSRPVEDAPFDIPESWEWVRLGEVADYAASKEKVSATEIRPDAWSLDLEDIEKDSGLVVRHCFARDRSITGEKVVIHKGQILYSKLRPYLKKILVAPEDGVCTPELVPFSAFGGIAPEYLVAVLKSPHVDFAINSVTYGVKMPRVGTDTMINLPIPLPPLAEQKRIVAKIEELLPYVERYEKAWGRLEEFNRRFPEDMRKSVLQMAIQGKLVEQRPEEGTGAELLREILAAKNAKTAKENLTRSRGVRGEKNTSALSAPPREEISDPPFDIPESWEWVRLGEVADVQLGKMLDKGKNKGTPHPYLANLSVRWGTFDLSELRMMPFTEDECSKFALLPGDILMCEGGVPGRCAVWREENSPIKYQKAVHRIRSKVLFPDYTQRFFEAICDSAEFADLFTGTTIKHLPREKLITIPISLPPLAEQKRIVAKLEEILPLCARLNGAMPL